ncbi:hypothetical protein DFH06DRAFT_1121128 [Mycena polygramma]|nr:hypothetical protein DFH06DRAFT_1121128 [Mycena polygramma]
MKARSKKKCHVTLRHAGPVVREQPLFKRKQASFLCWNVLHATWKQVDYAAAAASWYQQVMLLSTGDALVFSPAALMTADEQGGIGLLGRDRLKLRVHPRLTRDGGASLLAVGRSLPAISSAEPEPRVANDMTAASFTNAAATIRTAAPAIPFTAPASTTRSPAADQGPSTLAVAASSVPVARSVPTTLQPLMVWLTQNGAADAPVIHNYANYMHQVPITIICVRSRRLSCRS